MWEGANFTFCLSDIPQLVPTKLIVGGGGGGFISLRIRFGWAKELFVLLEVENAFFVLFDVLKVELIS